MQIFFPDWTYTTAKRHYTSSTVLMIYVTFNDFIEHTRLYTRTSVWKIISFPTSLLATRRWKISVATLRLWSGEGYYGINQHRMESGSQGLTGRSHHNLQEPKIFKTRTIKIFESHCKTYGRLGWGSHKTLQSNKNINSKTDLNFFFLFLTTIGDMR